MIEQLMLATVEELRRLVPIFTRVNCDAREAGRPPATSPEYYIGVNEAGEVNPFDPAQDHIKTEYRIEVVVSWRLGRFASDQVVSVYFKDSDGLGVLVRRVKAAVHGNQQIRIKANAMLETGDEAQQPLWYTGTSPTEYPGGEWDGSEAGGQVNHWAVRRVQFQGCLRVEGMNQLAQELEAE